MAQEFKDFFYQNFDRLHAYSFTIVLDNEEAKDIVQHAFIKLWEKWGQLKHQDEAQPYLYRSVYNLSLNAIRNRKTRDRFKGSLKLINVQHPDRDIEDKELSMRLNAGIENLPGRCKEVFKKSRYEGLKYAEIANDLGISIKTVEVHMTKALSILKETFRDLAFIILPILLSITNHL